MQRADGATLTNTLRWRTMTVLYITGLWRSGSTVLDIILGGHEAVEGVGELRSLPNIWLEGGTCACGEPAVECAFWSAVRDRWHERAGGERAAELIRLQDRFERTRALPRLLARGLGWRSEEFREYGRLVGAMYQAIADVSGKRVIVDSTKYPGRALALTRVPGIDLRILHLVRDGRAVIWSWRRKANTDLHGNVYEVDPAVVARMTTNSWIRANLYSGLARKVASFPTARVRYEDLIADPRGELAKIGRLVDLDFTDVAECLLAGDALKVNHPVAGNRVRHSGAVRLSPDLEWRERLPEEDRREFWRRAGWLAKRYGYAE